MELTYTHREGTTVRNFVWALCLPLSEIGPFDSESPIQGPIGLSLPRIQNSNDHGFLDISVNNLEPPPSHLGVYWARR